MLLEILNHKYQYEAEKLTRIFYPNEKITVVNEKSTPDSEAVLTTLFSDGFVTVEYKNENGDTLYTRRESTDGVSDKELLMAQLMFEALTRVTGYTPKWGILTGIRPSKLLIALKNKYGDEEGIRRFREDYLVSAEKTALADSVAKAEEKIISLSVPESFSLYVSIPFCPTRCSYCSFVSHDMTSTTIKKLMPDYVAFLIKEIEATAEIANNLGLRLESIYYGGGTPTTLDEAQLADVIRAVEANFDLSKLREYTIEAGRPDTVTDEKLRIMKAAGVSRISINPQSFSDEVLEAIGRKHTSKQTLEAFDMARRAGFDNINTDLIAGLPKDSLDGFKASLDMAVELGAENITVHTLALKRSSYMGGEGTVAVRRNEETQAMLAYAYSTLTDNGWHPYYMYRQTRSLGNLENTGYCKQGRECLYNVFMIEECHSVLAVGAGAVTRLKAPHGDKIDRIFNFKYPYEYIDGFDELINRKQAITQFYNENR
ncbi:MAG: coproporphyrinogen dehydrogenase HemZ [Clostridiaceae bacterium]|nr:coproporphyrinogen dehydrogenase HemZ [Clostridiaceae bacterium]